jgi:hypothetical protein
VNGLGFTYCVPSSWRVVGSRVIFAGGAIEWRMGSQREAGGSSRTVVEPVENAPSGPPRPARGASSLPSQRDRSTEVVDERRVELWSAAVPNGRLTGAIWTNPQIYFAGRANDAVGVALQFEVYRTVRFTRP